MTQKLKLWCVRCHHPELFPLLAEVPETKTETVSTKLSELPQSTTYHTITYKVHTGPCPLHRTEVRTNWGLAPCIGPKSGLTGTLSPASDQSPELTASDQKILGRILGCYKCFE